MEIEKNILHYIKSKGIPLTFICEKIGVEYKKIYPSFNGKRKLRADEFMAICEILNVEPNIFTKQSTA